MGVDVCAMVRDTHAQKQQPIAAVHSALCCSAPHACAGTTKANIATAGDELQISSNQLQVGPLSCIHAAHKQLRRIDGPEYIHSCMQLGTIDSPQLLMRPACTPTAAHASLQLMRRCYSYEWRMHAPQALCCCSRVRRPLSTRRCCRGCSGAAARVPLLACMPGLR
jgi:hypothetical protein